jgi:hypothetical protein
MPTVTQDVIRSYITSGQVWRIEHSALAVAAAGVSYIGFVTSGLKLEALGRSYASTGNALVVELFEATFTGGTNIRTLNRDLAVTTAPPVQMKTGITPGALGDVITGIRVVAATSTGSAQVGVNNDGSLLLLKPNTSYIIRMTNTGTGAADIGTSIDYRESI